MRNRLHNLLYASGLCRAATLIICCALLVFQVGQLKASQSQNPPRSTIGAGGTVAAQSATHRVSGTLGQVASNRAASPTNNTASGFWNTVGFCDCPFIGDVDTNSTFDILDVVAIVNVAFRNFPTPPGDPFCPLATRADMNCDGVIDVFDVVAAVNTAFRGMDSRCNPCET